LTADRRQIRILRVKGEGAKGCDGDKAFDNEGDPAGGAKGRERNPEGGSIDLKKQ